ncbi:MULTISPECIES: DUF4082 domain-containing protein [unclassified Microbacterium]|uniref:DUF4082 domain-containing protein n=1 Tax=unclassified Microbacterium TaxID=2609290 RepID=UPI00214AAC99|nr:MULTISPECIES: DUF4082 domain-containing protein [unclassified Microbacterium]MCR2808943.1 DUF4082 domain-containing protein [Microbacterium sp. zg.B185]WIM18640.1 DUF4082 domain-containing protein [Microbacterium sp. zg-B185]
MSHKALSPHAPLQLRLKRGLAVAATLAIALTGAAIAPALAAPTTTGIFADDLTPTTDVDRDRAAVELGVRFSPDTSGTVTAVQYYQSSGARNVTTATLWTEGGSVLATVDFPATTTPGWRTIPLTNPVGLTGDRTYVVSYQAPNGGYPSIERDLSSARSQNGFSLTANAGVYRYGDTSTVPTSAWQGSNYLVDVVYAPGAPAATPAPTVTSEPTAEPSEEPTATPTPTVTPRPTPTPTATPTPAPTPTATPEPPSSGGFVALGRTFPNSDTTGVPSGVALTDYTGPCAIQTAGYVIDGKQVNCSLRILAKDVVIKNSRINGTVYADYTAGAGSFTITDSEVFAGDYVGTGIGDAFFTALRVEVTGGTRSINCYADCTVQDSYVHGQLHDTTGVNHESGIRVNTNSNLIHNTIACDAPDFAPDAGCSAAITGYPDFDPVQNNRIDNNLIIAGSGGYCTYGGSTAGKPYSGQTRDIRFTNNVWQRGTQMGAGGRGYVCGYWGPITSFDINAPGAVWTNNLFDDGTVVAPAN